MIAANRVRNKCQGWPTNSTATLAVTPDAPSGTKLTVPRPSHGSERDGGISVGALYSLSTIDSSGAGSGATVSMSTADAVGGRTGEAQIGDVGHQVRHADRSSVWPASGWPVSPGSKGPKQAMRTRAGPNDPLTTPRRTSSSSVGLRAEMDDHTRIDRRQSPSPQAG